MKGKKGISVEIPLLAFLTILLLQTIPKMTLFTASRYLLSFSMYGQLVLHLTYFFIIFRNKVSGIEISPFKPVKTSFLKAMSKNLPLKHQCTVYSKFQHPNSILTSVFLICIIHNYAFFLEVKILEIPFKLFTTQLQNRV